MTETERGTEQYTTCSERGLDCNGFPDTSASVSKRLRRLQWFGAALSILSPIGIFFIFDHITHPSEEIRKSRFRAELAISEHRITWHEDDYSRTVTVTGTVTNAGPHSWNHVSIDLEMFDANERFIGEVNFSLAAEIAPGTDEHFQEECYLAPEVRPGNVSRTVIRIVNAL